MGPLDLLFEVYPTLQSGVRAVAGGKKFQALLTLSL